MTYKPVSPVTASEGELLDPMESSRLLERYGIRTPLQGLARDPDEAVRIMRKIGGPVALKVVSKGISHKSDVDGVRLSVGDEQRLREVFSELSSMFSAGRTGGLDGILVQKMVKGSPELIIGAKRDEVFGIVLLFGIGGVQTEIYKDVALCVDPWGDDDLERMIESIRGKALLEGFRGMQPVDKVKLRQIIGDLGRLMKENDDVIGVDLNPLIPDETQGVVAVDAKVFSGRLSVKSRENLADPSEIATILYPRSLAIIGASNDPKKLGGMILPNLLKFGFRKENIYLVNPSHKTIMDMQCYESSRSIPTKVDLACIIVPSRFLESALEDVGKSGIKAAIVFSSPGSASVGENPNEKLMVIAKKFGIRICGPNSEAVVCPSSNVCVTFSTRFDPFSSLKPGHSAVVSQSGAMTTYPVCTLQEQGIGFSKAISVGNGADLDVSDYLNFLAYDAETKVVGMFLEGVRDGHKFVRAVKALNAAGKPLIVLKGGRSDKGAQAAKLHTGSMTGTYATYHALFRQLGVIEAEDILDLSNLLMAFELQSVPKGSRLIVVSTTGGANTLVSDWCQERGVPLAELAEETRNRLKEILPEFGNNTNPLDLTASVITDRSIVEKSIDIVSDEGDIYLLVNLGGFSAAESFLRPCQRLMAKGRTVIVCWLTSVGTGQESRHFLINHGIPAYSSPLEAFKAVEAMIAMLTCQRRVSPA